MAARPSAHAGYNSIRDVISGIACGQFGESALKLNELREGKDPAVPITRWGQFLEILLKSYIPFVKSLWTSPLHKRGVCLDIRSRCDPISEKFQSCATLAATRRVMTMDKTKHVDLACSQMKAIMSTQRDLFGIYLRLISRIPKYNDNSLLSSGQTQALTADDSTWTPQKELPALQTLKIAVESNVTDEFAGKMRELIQFEIGTVEAIVEAQTALDNYNLKDTLVGLARAKQCLCVVHEITTSKFLLARGTTQSLGRKARTERSVENLKSCALLDHVLNTLAAKATLYFNPALTRQPSYNTKSVEGGLAKQLFIEKLRDFRRKTGASLVCIHYLAQSSNDRFHIYGYEHPDMPYDDPAGLRSFPPLFGCPDVLAPPTKGKDAPEEEREVHLVAPAQSATIYNIVFTYDKELCDDKIVCINESELRSSKAEKDKFAYYMIRADRRVIVTVVHQLHGKKKHEAAIATETKEFLRVFSNSLRNVWQSPVIGWLRLPQERSMTNR